MYNIYVIQTGKTTMIRRTDIRIILKALTGTNWGKQKETMLVTYKSLIRSLFMYAVPIWLRYTLPSLVQILQSIQNTAPRIASACVKMTFIDLVRASNLTTFPTV